VILREMAADAQRAAHLERLHSHPIHANADAHHPARASGHLADAAADLDACSNAHGAANFHSLTDGDDASYAER
jgi:hypothetical protein